LARAAIASSAQLPGCVGTACPQTSPEFPSMGSLVREMGPFGASNEPVESFREATETTEMLNSDQDSHWQSRVVHCSSSQAPRRRLLCHVACLSLLLGFTGVALGGQLHGLIIARFIDAASWVSSTTCTKSWCSLVSDHSITNLRSGRCLDWGKFVVQSRTCNRSSKSQLWVYNKTKHIQVPDGYCLDGGGKNVHVWPCEANGSMAVNQRWEYNLITGQIAKKNTFPELCLEESQKHSSVSLKTCDPMIWQQRWRVKTSSVSHVHLVETGQIQLGHRSCLDASAKTHVAICNASNRNQLWSYSLSTKQIRGHDGGCLDANSIDTLRPCREVDPSQQWHADLATGQLQSMSASSGNCLRGEEATDRTRVTPTFLAKCDVLDSGQRWKLKGLMLSDSQQPKQALGSFGVHLDSVQVAYAIISFVGGGSFFAIMLLLCLRRGGGGSSLQATQRSVSLPRNDEPYDLKARPIRAISTDSTNLADDMAKQETSSVTTATSNHTLEPASLIGSRPTSLMAGAQLSMWETASSSASSSSTLRERAQRQVEGSKPPLLPGVPERYVLTEDATYNGEWRARRPHGRGTQSFPDGGRFQGDLSSGNAYGWGSFEYADGSMYTGTWFNDLAQGQGTLDCPDKWVYKGLFDKGKPHGHGTLTLQDGSTFTGQYKQGAKDGVGVFVFRGEQASGSYEGQYIKDACHGKGIFKWDDGCKYEGQWRHGKKHGRGQLTFPDGCCYDGAFEADQKNGPGTMEWADGCRYTGEWSGGRQHGRGAYYDGRITTEGLWEMGRRKAALNLAQA